MKNVSFALFFLLLGSSVSAQQKQNELRPITEKQNSFIRNNTTPLKALHGAANKKNRGGSRWYDIVDAIDKDQGGGGAIYQNDNYNILWQDSTLLAPFGSGANTVYDGIWIKSIAAFFDPSDPRYNDPAQYPNEVAINKSSTYTLDSLFLPFIYRRNLSKPSVVDTLVVSVIKGNGGGNNADLGIRYYGPATATATNHNVDTLRFLHGFLNLNTASNNLFTFEASVPANVVNLKIPLTAATLNDTLSNGFNYFQIPINMQIPAGYIPAVSVTFKSGDTWIPYVDTLYISGNTNYKFNHFRFVAFEENAGLYQTYIKNYYSQSSIMRNDTTGWHNWHIPSYAFTNTTYEHHWFSWKATCANCGTVGINNTEDPTAQLSVYPNPSNGLLHLNLNAETEWRNTQLELISFDGKIIYTEAIPKIAANNPFTKTLNVASVAKGIYLLKMTADNHSAVQKIIIE